MKKMTRYKLFKASAKIEPETAESNIYNARVSKAYPRKINQSPVLSRLRDLLINARVGTVLTYDTGNSFEIYEKVIDHATEGGATTMAKYFIAKAVKGKEYFYSKYSVTLVPTASAHKICKVLNDNNYNLKDGEIWHVYEWDDMTEWYATHEIKSYNRKRLLIWAV